MKQETIDYENYQFDLTKDERPLVDDFISLINFRCYIYKDQDIGKVRAPSEWDFVLSRNNRTIYIEAKKNNNWLNDTQKLAEIKCRKANVPYWVLWFHERFENNVCLSDKNKIIFMPGLINILNYLDNTLKP